MPDKEKAWNDLIKLANDENSIVRSGAISILSSVFLYAPDKLQAWNDLHRLINDEDSKVRSKVADAIASAFPQVLDKQKAWNDLHRLINDKNSKVRYRAASTLAFVFSYVSDKQQAWNDLIKLVSDKDGNVRSIAESALSSAFTQVPDKQQAWDDLHRLTNSIYWDVRYRAANALVPAFTQISNKQQIWEDLHRLTKDEDSNVRRGSAFAIASVFVQVLDKQQAWDDLHRLTKDGDSNVRHASASAIASVFAQAPDKEQALNDLNILTNDEDVNVRQEATSYLGFVFSHVSNKQRVWNYLIQLTNDKNVYVRVYANCSLGKASIFKASQAEHEEIYRNELEKAIMFFEKATQESPSEKSNPAQFCLPFYRSFHIIVFKKREAKEEVDKYLTEARDSVRGSKSKELLFEAVNNLANALKEVQYLENLDLEAKKGELNFFRQYCDRAAELMNDAEEIAPFAIETMRKGFPFFDKKLKFLIEEIQKKAKTACRESQGTDAQEIACLIKDKVQEIQIQIESVDQGKYIRVLDEIISVLDLKIPSIPENKLILNKLESIKNKKYSNGKYDELPFIISLIPTINMISEQTIKNQLNPLKEGIKELDEKTTTMIEKLEEIKYLSDSVDRLIESIDKLQNPQEYIDIIQQNLKEIKDDIPEMKEQIYRILDELDSPLNTTQKLKISIPIIPLLVSYEQETDVPKLVANSIHKLKSLILRFK
ncbi:MAG: HEAT repeat domain-containing protein [Methanosarcina barkeri]|nr:HEAT repeat domain-containing protein [Methanosarcina sp. ERenArc_MAG2]